VQNETLPVAILGAGPIGLAAAAHLIARGQRVQLFERASAPAASLREWGHITLFTPWRYIIDEAAAELLSKSGWRAPEPDRLPSGREVVHEYLEPLSKSPEIARSARYQAEIIAVSRQNLSKLDGADREAKPFALTWRDAAGVLHQSLARAVLDARGVWAAPNPLGAGGLAVEGEVENRDRIAYGPPDVLAKHRALYAGRRTLVVGSGHSAIHAVLDLTKLRAESEGTEVLWAMRRSGPAALQGDPERDELPARGALGARAADLARRGEVEVLSPAVLRRIAANSEGRLDLDLDVASVPRFLTVDHIVGACGFRPELESLHELRLALDPAIEAPSALAPEIDPRLHSCGTVPPHGVDELSHPEPNFFIVGSKAYGRAPTFLLRTGYEQVRSIAADLSGDHASARRLSLALPETGVCGGDGPDACCPPKRPTQAARSCSGSSAVELGEARTDAGCCG